VYAEGSVFMKPAVALALGDLEKFRIYSGCTSLVVQAIELTW